MMRFSDSLVILPHLASFTEALALLSGIEKHVGLLTPQAALIEPIVIGAGSRRCRQMRRSARHRLAGNDAKNEVPSHDSDYKRIEEQNAVCVFDASPCGE
jgi:hypothetical protein